MAITLMIIMRRMNLKTPPTCRHFVFDTANRMKETAIMTSRTLVS